MSTESSVVFTRYANDRLLTTKQQGVAPTSFHDLYVVIGTSTFLQPVPGTNYLPVQITEFGPVGGYIPGTFSAALLRNRYYSYGTINVDFRIKRLN